MKKVFFLLASVAVLAADVSAARLSLLDLIGGGSRRASRAKRTREDRPARAAGAEAAAAEGLAASNSVAAVLASTNGVEIESFDVDAAPAGGGTNAAPREAAEAARPAPKREGRPAHITSSKVYYDRKEGYAVFTGRVHVDAEEYQLHAQKAYVFFEGTNELKRVVATGSVAITNETRRAYGAKASYYRKSGMVVLYGDDAAAAEVRDEAKGEDQVVKGSQIRFWIDSEQVEVVDARISAPVSGGLGDLKDGLRRGGRQDGAGGKEPR